MMEPEAGFSDKKITFLVHFSQPATSSELNRRVFPPGYAGLLTSLEIQDPLFELEVAAVEIVKIAADKPGYGSVK